VIVYDELLELVLARNPFHQARLAGWDRSRPLPPLTKSELVADQAAHPPFGTNLTYELDRYVAVHQTSGTTGPPLRVLDTAEDWAWWRACLARSFEQIGIGARDRVALAFSFGPHIHFWATKEGLQEVGAMAVVTGGMTSAQRLQTIADTRATALACTPTYALRLHEVAVEQRMEAALDTIEAVVCTGEPGASLPAVRSAIEEAFGARVYEHAGSSEAGPFGHPCPEGGGLHVDGSQFACEIVGADLEPVPPGERGELLVTPLGRTGFPVLRYRTGDVVLNTDEPCPGGHHDRWLPGGIVGRTDDMVVIRGMNVFPSAVEEAVRSVTGSGEFRITFYTERGGMDEIKLEVELADGSRAGRLQEVMRHQLGLRIRIVPVAAGVLPRSESKSRRVVDLRERGWS
jgi:phenylacetate-CoA ligase